MSGAAPLRGLVWYGSDRSGDGYPAFIVVHCFAVEVVTPFRGDAGIKYLHPFGLAPGFMRSMVMEAVWQ
jgi:hypothetical protein